VLSVIVLTLAIPRERLAESTPLATLVVFALVNVLLLRLRRQNIAAAAWHIRVPLWVPIIGFVTVFS